MKNREPVYVEGVEAAIEALYSMTDEALLSHMDILYGRDRLPVNFTRDDLLREATRQTRLDFLNPLHEDFHFHQKTLEEMYSKE
jgi:hypothetical protein